MSRHQNPAGPKDRRSPLYTPPHMKLIKLETIRDRGKDLDGAYRATRRLDDRKETRR